MAISTQLYYGGTLPQGFTWQALSFLRCEWPFLFTGADRLRTVPVGDAPTTRYVVRADGDVLLSYAEILRVMAARAGEPVRVLGVSNVFTFPPYRHEGHAAAMMRVIGERIDEGEAELGILFCEKQLTPFYAAHGWQVAPADSIQAPGAAPCTMVRTTPAKAAQLAVWLSAAPVLLDSRW